MANDWKTDETPLDECVVFREKFTPDPDMVRAAIRVTRRVLAERKVDHIAQARAEGAAEERAAIVKWLRSRQGPFVHGYALSIAAIAHREPVK